MDRLIEDLEQINRLQANGHAQTREDVLESLQYVLRLLDDIVESAETVQVVFRLPVELVNRLDAYTKRLNAADPGRRMSRNAVVHQLLMKSLTPGDKHTQGDKEKEHKGKRKTNPREPLRSQA